MLGNTTVSASCSPALRARARCVALQPEANAIDEETDACHGRNRDYQRGGQQPQFTRAPVAQRHAKGLGQKRRQFHRARPECLSVRAISIPRYEQRS
jgi:hypothetical protein